MRQVISLFLSCSGALFLCPPFFYNSEAVFLCQLGRFNIPGDPEVGLIFGDIWSVTSIENLNIAKVGNYLLLFRVIFFGDKLYSSLRGYSIRVVHSLFQ